MSTPLVLFLALGCCSVLLSMWAALTAGARYEDLSKSHRALGLVTALAAPAATIAAVFGGALSSHWALTAHAALPVLALVAAWCNITTLQHQNFALKVLHLPIFLFNALLAGIYAVRVAQDSFGIDLGPWGAAVTGGHAMLQRSVGQPDADVHPIWFYVPLLLPLTLRYRWPHTLGLLCASALATVMLSVLIAIMPFAFSRAQSYREAAVCDAEVHAEMRLSVELPRTPGTTDGLAVARRTDLADLGAHGITVSVDPEALARPDVVEQLLQQVDAARAARMGVTVVARPGAWHAPVDMHRLTTTMAKLHWLAAEKLEPDYLVLFSGPFASLAEHTLKIGTVDEWFDAIRRSADDVRQANPAVRVAISLESQAPHAEELFRRLRADGSPVDAVGFSISGRRGLFGEVEARMRTLDRWMREHPGPTPIHILETRVSPYTAGGELGQWRFLAAVLDFAARQGIRTVALPALVDNEEANGLVTRRGHRRMAFHRLERCLEKTSRPDEHLALGNPGENRRR